MASHVADDFASRPQGERDAFDAHAPWEGVRDVPAFDEVYDRHFAYVHRAMRHLGVSDAALDDAVQDAFVVVHQKLAEFDGRHLITTWLYAIVIRVARRYRKSQASAHAFDSEQELESPHVLDDDLEVRRKLLIAEQALASLHKDKREVFVLGEIEQMSVVEIAKVLGEPVDTIYSRLRVAKEAFHKASRRVELKLRRAP
jgi:RNA polymerase sigma-70 factor, ECF subfamily